MPRVIRHAAFVQPGMDAIRYGPYSLNPAQSSSTRASSSGTPEVTCFMLRGGGSSQMRAFRIVPPLHTRPQQRAHRAAGGPVLKSHRMGNRIGNADSYRPPHRPDTSAPTPARTSTYASRRPWRAPPYRCAPFSSSCTAIPETRRDSASLSTNVSILPSTGRRFALLTDTTLANGLRLPCRTPSSVSAAAGCN